MSGAVWNNYEHCDQSWIIVGPPSFRSPCPACHTVVSPRLVDYETVAFSQPLPNDREEMLTMLEDASNVLYDTNDIRAQKMSVKIDELLKRMKA